MLIRFITSEATRGRKPLTGWMLIAFIAANEIRGIISAAHIIQTTDLVSLVV